MLCDWFVQLINQMVLNNRRLYADLRSKLLLGDIDRERRQQLLWKKGLDTWKQLHIDAAVDEFKYESLLFSLRYCHRFTLLSCYAALLEATLYVLPIRLSVHLSVLYGVVT